MITPSIVANDCAVPAAAVFTRPEIEHLDEILSAADPSDVNVGSGSP